MAFVNAVHLGVIAAALLAFAGCSSPTTPVETGRQYTITNDSGETVYFALDINPGAFHCDGELRDGSSWTCKPSLPITASGHYDFHVRVVYESGTTRSETFRLGDLQTTFTIGHFSIREGSP